MADLGFVVGDTAPSVFGAITNTDGTVFDLTGCTVRFQMRWLLDNRFAVDAVATIVDAPTGAVRYDWEDGDLSQPGSFVSRWKIILADSNKEHTQPANTIAVEAA